MRVFIFIGLLLFSFQNSQAQDTLVVQTFDYSMTYGNGPWAGIIRDTMAYFPSDASQSFEKIILSYNMRCKDNAVNPDPESNSIGCGAWDYTCNTHIHDSTRMDSVLHQTASHAISGFSGESYDYSINPVYNYIALNQQIVSLEEILSEDTTVIGNGNEALDFVIETDQNAHKSQFIYLAEEMNQFGLVNDSIDALSLQLLSNDEWAQFLSVKLKLTTDTVLSEINPHKNGFTEVYHAHTLLTNGNNRLQFHTPFPWDSLSNVIVEFSLTNSTAGGASLIAGELQSNTMGLHTNDANHITIGGAGNMNIPTDSLASIGEEITISIWINGNADVMPMSTTLFEGFDSNGNRTVNVHLPWDDGNVYWDCGNDGGSYDRIYTAANLDEYTDGWHHWAFTKNTISGEMNIFLNGALWHSGTDKTLPMAIASLKLGSNPFNDRYWDGQLKEFRIFNKALDQATIQEWMNTRINESHPYHENLLAHYPFNEGDGQIANDNSDNTAISNFGGIVNWNTSRGDKLEHFFTATKYRPNLTFFQGDYSTTTTDFLAVDSLIANPNTVTEYAIVSIYNGFNDDSIASISSNTYWEAISHTFDNDGNIISSNNLSEVDGTINVNSLYYYKRYPMAFQIMSFVTPYGYDLDFGPNGKTWYFDVTDFAPILEGPKRITIDGGGQWQEDMDIKFLFITGTPTREVLDMQQLWKVQSRNHIDIMANDAFEPRTIALANNADAFKLRTAITGHGQEGEFIPQEHTLTIDNGAANYEWDLWTECSDNPIYPQGGTWLIDRAGWCPGEATDLREDDITSLVSAGATHTFDYGVNGGSGDTKYWVSSQLVSYGAPNFELNAGIEAVISPSMRPEFIRYNPVCGNPTVVIKNLGTSTLTSLSFEYEMTGGTSSSYEWSGELAYLETETVTLPSFVYNGTANIFNVRISNPNGGVDEQVQNNRYSSAFETVPNYPNEFKVVVEANNFGFENAWVILGMDGTPLYWRSNLSSNSFNVDTVNLPNGCYLFDLTDSGENGLNFWWSNATTGTGTAKFQQIFPPSILTTFEPDFGSGIAHYFTVGGGVTIDEQETNKFIVYPNPTNGAIQVRWELDQNKKVKIQVCNLIGKLIWEEESVTNNVQKSIKLDQHPNGVYLLKVQAGKEIRTEKIILSR